MNNVAVEIEGGMGNQVSSTFGKGWGMEQVEGRSGEKGVQEVRAPERSDRPTGTARGIPNTPGTDH